MIDTSQLNVGKQLILGTIPGRWSENDALVPPIKWDSLPKDAGFTGVELEISDCEDSNYQSSRIILSTAPKRPAFPAEISLLHAESKPPATWVSSLRREIQESTGAILSSAQRLEDATVKGDSVCIFIAEMKQPLLDNINSATFDKLRKLLLSSAGLLWLIRGSIAASGAPKFGLTQGLLRTLREEDASKRIVHLDFEQGTDKLWSDSKRKHTLHVLGESFDERVDLSSTEREYAIKDSILHVMRAYTEGVEENATVTSPIDPEVEMLPWHQPGRNWVYEVDPNGLLNNTYFVDNPAIAGDVPREYVEIEPKPFGLNFRDVLISLGQLDRTLIGNECSRIVTRLGPNADTATSGLKVGNRVCAIAETRFGSKVFSRWSSAAAIPNTMSFEEAATIPYI
ncbi:hypothetical protein F4825DRAFT_444405 [Nemania diffusa]|nr:hypothetical protein F4825DRAFT_444405 [Nemania diffusa]